MSSPTFSAQSFWGTRNFSIDFIRGIAILLVLIGHCGTAKIAYLDILLSRGAQGVNLFFVLSGFLITSLLNREIKQFGKISLPYFYLRRLFRLAPAFITYLTVTYCLSFFVPFIAVSFREIWLAGLYLWNYFGTENWWLGHTWTLAVEEQFYLVWPMILSLVPRKNIQWVIIICIVLAPIIRVATYHAIPELRPRITIMFHTRFDSILFGSLLAFIAQDASHRLHQAIKSVRWFYCALAFLLVAPIFSYFFRGIYWLPLGISLESLASAQIIGYLYFHGVDTHRVLNLWVARLGIISYGVYLWQQIFCTENNPLLIGNFPLNIICAIAAGTISYHWVEAPFNKFKTRFERGSLS